MNEGEEALDNIDLITAAAISLIYCTMLVEIARWMVRFSSHDKVQKVVSMLSSCSEPASIVVSI